MLSRLNLRYHIIWPILIDVPPYHMDLISPSLKNKSTATAPLQEFWHVNLLLVKIGWIHIFPCSLDIKCYLEQTCRLASRRLIGLYDMEEVPNFSTNVDLRFCLSRSLDISFCSTVMSSDGEVFIVGWAFG